MLHTTVPVVMNDDSRSCDQNTRENCQLDHNVECPVGVWPVSKEL